MDSTKYCNIMTYLRNSVYPDGFDKQAKSILRRLCKKYAFDEEKNTLFYLEKKDGSTVKRIVIQEDEKLRVFQECHLANFAGHVGRDNTLRKIKDRYYWPEYYKDTLEMVRK